MPRGDRTGPGGMGPRTGRRMGYCAGFDMPGAMNRPRFGMYGGGFGMGHGGGRGFRHRFFAWGAPYAAAEANPDWEMDDLKAQAETLKKELQAIEKRLDALNREKPNEGE